jgi:hippurate hydrolase
LARTRHFNGTVHLIFQPAEEIGAGGGAERMLADGLFERFPCDAIFGLHNHPGVEAGTFMFRAGPFMAACDTVNVTIRGKGGQRRVRIIDRSDPGGRQPGDGAAIHRRA